MTVVNSKTITAREVDAQGDPTTGTADVFIPEIWSDKTIDAIEFAANIQNFVTREYEGLIRQGGDTVHVPRISNLSTQTKSAGLAGTIKFEAVTETKQDITIATHEYAAFMIESVAAVQSNVDLLSKYTKKIGYALSRGREVSLANLAQSLSQYVGTYGVDPTADDFLAVYQKFAEAGLVETGESINLFVSPATYVAMLKCGAFINRDYNPKADAVGRAYIGDVYTMNVMMSNLLRSPAPGQHDCFAATKGCFALCVQDEVPVRSQWVINNIADAVVGWNLYGVAEIAYPVEDAATDGTPSTAVDNRGVLIKAL